MHMLQQHAQRTRTLWCGRSIKQVANTATMRPQRHAGCQHCNKMQLPGQPQQGIVCSINGAVRLQFEAAMLAHAAVHLLPLNMPLPLPQPPSQGTIDPCSGAVRLQFEAAMLAQVGSRPPTPLPLSTCLTSEPASAFKVTLQGQRMLDGRVT